MTIKKLLTKKLLIGSVAGAILSTGIMIGCSESIGPESREGSHEGASIARDIGGESAGEHSGSAESGRESGTEGPEGGGGSEEGSGTSQLAPNETFDETRGGARLIMNYDAAGNAFTGTVENTTNNTLTNVRIEVHLSNGVELGPTTPVDMAAGEVIAIDLPSTPEPFTGWTPHAEVGSGEGGGETAGGESGPDGPEGPESGTEAAMEAAMSSPITPLDQAWNGVLGGLAVSARYDAATQSVHTTVQNTTSQTLCYVQAEPHLKSGTQTVGELGPGKMGDLNPGQEASSILAVSAEPELAGVVYDGYVVHMEVFDCGGPGPVAHTGSEGGSGEGAGGEGHGPGGEGSGSEVAEGSGGSEEGSGASQLALNETFDEVRGGARLVMVYDAPTNSFRAIVENTTGNTLTNVRIEVHLSNGTELGPTTPVNMAPGQVMRVILPSTPEPFTGWTPHAEVGSGEGVARRQVARVDRTVPKAPRVALRQPWKRPCPARSPLWTRPGTEFWVDWQYRLATTRQPSRCTRRYRTRPRRRCAMCRPNLT